MKKSEYWQKRMMLLEEASHRKAEEAYKASEEAIENARRQLDRDIAKWIGRIADNNGISIEEARKYLKEAELEEFRWDLDTYIKKGKESAYLNGKWEKELENASARWHISRLDAMKLQIQQHLETAYSTEHKAIADTLTDIYQDSFYHNGYEVMKGIGVGWKLEGIDRNKINNVISTPWASDELTFSSRIWRERTQMINQLQNELTKIVMTGSSPRDSIDALTKFVDKKYAQTARAKAGRLISTEATAIATKAQQDCFKELGVEQYEIVATLDGETCEECGSYDGKIYPMKEFVAGVTAPPFHPSCRCCTAPYYDDEFSHKGERAYRGEDGETHYVKDMSYEEWKNKYIPRLEEGMPVKLALSGNIYANSTDQLAVNAKKIKPIDGFTDIVAHGDEYSIVFKDTRGNEENVSAAEFAEILQASGGYKGGNIRLFACSTGAGEGIVPQYLADKLGVDILAPTEDITVFKDGSFIVANDDTDAIMGIETGKWKLFKPRKRK